MRAPAGRRLPMLRWVILCAAAAGVLVTALGFGASPAGWNGIADLLMGRASGPTRAILLDVRLPRILLAAVVGAALAGAGTAFQAILRNPLADPYILGVSGGAALGAAVFTALAGGDPLGGPLARPLAAFAGALVTLLVLFRLARLRGRTGSMALLLVGVVLNAFDSAVILFLLTVGDTARFQGVMSFLVGSVGSFPWAVVAAAGVLVGVGLATLLAMSHRLNLLGFGEETAGDLGVDVERTVWTVVAAASLATAAGVAFTGLIGFVGLIVPHALRIVFGSDHRALLPASAVGGAAFLVLADTAARTVVAPVELPVGVLTALIGCPLFLVLFLRRLREA